MLFERQQLLKCREGESAETAGIANTAWSWGEECRGYVHVPCLPPLNPLPTTLLLHCCICIPGRVHRPTITPWTNGAFFASIHCPMTSFSAPAPHFCLFLRLCLSTCPSNRLCLCLSCLYFCPCLCLHVCLCRPAGLIVKYCRLLPQGGEAGC